MLVVLLRSKFDVKKEIHDRHQQRIEYERKGGRKSCA